MDTIHLTRAQTELIIEEKQERLKRTVQKQQDQITFLESEIARLEGLIEGLRFSTGTQLFGGSN